MEKIIKEAIYIQSPTYIGSYKEEDCIFLLKDISHLVTEKDDKEREEDINDGVHYSQMLPFEDTPSDEYMNIFYESLKENAMKVAVNTLRICEQILKNKGNDVILVSLARGGTPVGVLAKRYIKYKYNIDCPHYSLSIIRDKGLDENALIYIINKHKSTNIQFIDAWTGKGVVNHTLEKACREFNMKYEVDIDSGLAVLSDVGRCAKIYGTREDFLIPSACLNSTGSGLISRTFLDDKIISKHDFHGAKYYSNWKDIDCSNYFVDYISELFEKIDTKSGDKYTDINIKTAREDLIDIQKRFGVDSIRKIKAGIGETTRVLLRKIPYKILVSDINNPNVKYVLLLAKDRGIPIEIYKDMNYLCCALVTFAE
ncbi:cysteine protease StiP family protein [Alkalithermobacter paradoxus]|uniref:Cysteine protease StiP n=1 Tax=Alkalithermobacter paradoxus TaxID=29349 RepID=A0A1V4I6P5_9FIRM|nr:cysteine protease StiP precursor [[Clostridium] thermoalcaliphilum]